MADKSWKAFERRVAGLVRGSRVGPDHRKDGIDVDAPLFAYQCKLTGRGMLELRRWLDGICDSACSQGSTWCGARASGVVVWKVPRMLDGDALVTLRLRDWVEVLQALDMVKLAGLRDGEAGQLKRAKKKQDAKSGRA